MGVLDWVRRTVSGGRDVAAGAGDAAGEGSVHVRVSMHAGTGCVELGGTTTNSREHAQRLFTDAGYPSGGLIYRDGVLVPEPTNEVDPSAVAVHIAGERAGYLPSWLAARIVDDLQAGTVVPVQLWAVVDADELRVRAFAWLGAGEPQWDFDASKPAPVTPAQKKALVAQQAAELREKRLAEGGATAEIQRNAMVRGKHYTEWPEGVRELKREQRYDEALVLLYELIAAAERDASRQDYGAPAPWYTEQAAIIHRKLKDFDGEIAVLERYRSSHRSAAAAFGDRLEKAVALQGRAR